MYDQDITSEEKIQVQKRDLVSIHPALKVKQVLEGRRHMEVIYMARATPGGVIKKLNRDEYLDTRTGEVREFVKSQKKQRENLRETFRNLTALIRANFDAENENRQLFITLTYAQNMTDHNRLYADFRDWYKRLKRHCKGHVLDYIAVAEPQGRGAWHMHVMLKSDKVLFVDNRDMARLWGHGMTDTQRLKSDDVGRYYVAYFTDLFGEFGVTARKKGARLPFYPVGMKFYRCSRGIKRPIAAEVTYGTVQESIQANEMELAGWNAYDIMNERGELVQTVQREHYKRRGR